ncbi:MAG: SDR family oxidoreductase [Solobacterium sp.]|nr:SDR family oxidoreductase [Solobacterium sp.]
MGKFNGKTAIVTGGGSGLGRAICRRLAKEGAKIAVADIKMEGAEETVAILKEEGGEGFAVYADVTNAASVEEMVQKVVSHFGQIDFLVNNCGMAIESRKGMRVCDTPEEIWDLSMNLNLKSVYLDCKYVIPEMIKAGKGAIVNVSSLAAYFPAFGASYAAAKAGVLQLTASIAMQYADDNIRCNAVCPGPMQTPTGMNANKIGGD